MLPAGDNWELSGGLSLKCLNYNAAKKTDNDFGIGLWLVKNSPRTGIIDYNFDDFSSNFGMNANVEGLGLVFYRNTLHTGFFKSSNMTRDDILDRAKTCKAYLEKEKEIMFTIKYRGKVLGVYITEPKDRTETLCYQFTDIPDLEEFFFAASASDMQSYCAAEITALVLRTTYTGHQFVEAGAKKPEDKTFAYFEKGSALDQKHQFDHFQKVYDFYRENAKIFAKQLLVFADKNEKELISDIKAEITNTDQALDKSIKIIEDEAKQIEALNVFLNTDRKSMSENVNQLLDQILLWMAQMDEAFDRVDTETEQIYNSITKIKFDDQLDKLISRAKKVGDSLMGTLGKAQKINKSKGLNDIKEEDIESWNKDVHSLYIDVKTTFKESDANATSRIQQLVLAILGIVGVAIIIGFLIMYLKIRKAMRYKRIL